MSDYTVRLHVKELIDSVGCASSVPARILGSENKGTRDVIWLCLFDAFTSERCLWLVYAQA
jgi:hypothetical protein